jgi:outer membrane PBP1 activator LpoA protein
MTHCQLLKFVPLTLLIVTLAAGCSAPQPKSRQALPAPLTSESQTTAVKQELDTDLAVIRSALTDAEEAWQAGAWRTALSHIVSYRQVVLPSPEEQRRQYLEAMIAIQQGEYNKAKDHLTDLIRRDDYALEHDPIALRLSLYQQARLHHDLSVILVEGSYLLNQPLTEARLKDQIVLDQALAIASLSEPELKRVSKQLSAYELPLLEAAIRSRVARQDRIGIALCQAWSPIDSIERSLTTLCSADPQVNSDAIIVALPLSGRLKVAGEAILDGILSRQLGGEAIGSLTIIDTASEPLDELVRLMNESVTPPTLIGPLQKDKLDTLARAPQPTPGKIVALNSLDASSLPPTNWIQLSLSPEAQAAALAEQVYAAQARRVIIIRPLSDWGARTLVAFTETWNHLGGQVVTTATYRGQTDYETAIQAALGVADSAVRRRELGRAAGLSTYLQNRRRQDIDAIILLASNPEEARSIKPLLAFHFANDIPAYSLSVINQLPTELNHSDLDGLYTLDIENLNPIPTEQALSAPLARLTALGQDAHHFAQYIGRGDGPLRSMTRGSIAIQWIDEMGIVQHRWTLHQYNRQRLERQR